eukprot:802594-Pelagomonas_calceolata.AAC.1
MALTLQKGNIMMTGPWNYNHATTAEMNAKAAQLAGLQSEAQALAVEVASMAVLEHEVANLREQLQAIGTNSRKAIGKAPDACCA